MGRLLGTRGLGGMLQRNADSRVETVRQVCIVKQSLDTSVELT